jgi:prepilin-type N-terminal cleavage/methylation domain-containing protein
MRKSFTLIELLVVIALIAVLVSALAVGTLWPLQALWYLVAGWAYFFGRNVPRAEPGAEAGVTGLVALLVLTAAAHLLLRRGFGPAWRFRKTAAVVGVVVLVFTAGVAAVGVTHQAAWLAGTEQRRTQVEAPYRFARNATQSQNNLRNLGVALENFQSMDPSRALPPATGFDAHGRLMHGWQTHLLPYVEQERLFKTIDLKRPWDVETNRAAFAQSVPVYSHPQLYPTNDPAGYALTIYAANVHALGGDRPRRLDGFPRGAANTLLIGEAAGNFKPWGSPLNVREPTLGLNTSPNGFGNPFDPKRRTQFLMADGSVRTFTGDADPEFLRMLAFPNPE